MWKKTRRYCLQAFRKTDILRGYIKDCFKINGKQRVKMPTKGEYVKFKNYERKIKSLFMLYVNFGSIPLPEEHIACSYDYKLVCVDDKFTQPYKSYLGENTVYSFIDSMVEESKYCGDGMKNILTENLQ